MNKYAIFGVVAGLALLTTTIVSVLPVQRALAVCTSNPSTSNKFACANDRRTGGGAVGFFHGSGQLGAASVGIREIGGAGHACAAGLVNFPAFACAP